MAGNKSRIARRREPSGVPRGARTLRLPGGGANNGPRRKRPGKAQSCPEVIAGDYPVGGLMLFWDCLRAHLIILSGIITSASTSAVIILGARNRLQPAKLTQFW